MKRRNFLKKSGLSTAGLLSVPGFFSNNINPGFNLNLLTDKKTYFGDGRDWFVNKRFGMFVHWGLYSIPGWNEQHLYRMQLERSEYKELTRQWNPIDFDPDHWLDILEETGMEYLCVTTKHIDGFCLWDTKYTDFNTMNTPYGKDIIGMISEACHRRNIPLCLYYSVADLTHPNYPHEGRLFQWDKPLPGDQPNLQKYIEFLRNQIRELCTNYGTIHGIWWDCGMFLDYRNPDINNMIRELQPNAVINDRGFDDGDFSTPEREYFADEKREFNKLVEACQSVGMESWGYRTNEDYYTHRHLIRSIDKYFARGANYLLNVGPDYRGNIPPKQKEILSVIGNWHHTVRESFDDALPAPDLISNKDVMITKKDNIIYVHANTDLKGNVIKLSPISKAPKEAILLNTGENIDFEIEFLPSEWREKKKHLRLCNLPVNEMCDTVMIIKLIFEQ